MKELKNIDSVKIYNGEIVVKPYLTYAEIEEIAKAVGQFDDWASREQNLDILLVHFATNLSNEDIESIGHESLVTSGVIDEIKKNVKNFDRIYEAINYNESTQRALLQITKQLPEILEPLKKVVNRGNKSSKK